MMNAIDIHAHWGDPTDFPQKGLAKTFLYRTPEQMQQDYRAQNISAAVFSPMQGLFAADAAQLLQANADTAAMTERFTGFYFWVVVHPRVPESFAQAELLLKHEKCVGVKIHPEAGGYPISEYGEDIFAFCAKHGAILLAHSGDPLCMPEAFVPFADRYLNVTMILAHLGYGSDGVQEHQVNALQSSQNRNIYIDVSSVKSIQCGLIEWAAEAVGAEHLLFGTDVPLHHIGMMKARVEFSDLRGEEKRVILYENAYRIFQGRVK